MMIRADIDPQNREMATSLKTSRRYDCFCCAYRMWIVRCMRLLPKTSSRLGQRSVYTLISSSRKARAGYANAFERSPTQFCCRKRGVK